MRIPNGSSVRQRLFLGFVICTLITGAAIVVGMIALSQINNDLSVTTDSVGVLLDNMQNTVLKIEKLRKALQSIRQCNDLKDLDSIRENFNRQRQGFTDPRALEWLTRIEKDFLPAKANMLRAVREHENASGVLSEARAALAEWDTKLVESKMRFENLVADLNKCVMTLADTSEFDAVIRIEDGVRSLKERVEKDGVDKDTVGEIDKFQETTEQATSTIRIASSTCSESYKLNVLNQNVLLSNNPAFVDYSVNPINNLISNIQEKLDSLPESDETSRAALKLKELKPVLAKVRDLKKEAITSQALIQELQRKVEQAGSEMSTSQADMESVAVAVEEQLQRLASEARMAVDDARVAAKNTVSASYDNVSGWRSVLLLIGLASFAIAILVGVLVARTIIKPIQSAKVLAETIKSGNLSQRLDLKSNDEIGQLCHSLDAMVDGLYIKAELASAIARGDLTQDVTLASDNDMLGKALLVMAESLNEIVTRIDDAAMQVAACSNEVSSASQLLSNDASNQAASLEQIVSSVNQMDGQTQTSSENAKQAEDLVCSVRDIAENGYMHIEEMNAAMDEINDSSRQISKIIKVIDDIAFQTNLLALNAAVEAARAGVHGKGFAVVAEEVRNLAVSCAKAANETSELIERSTQKVSRGTQITYQTSVAFQEIVEGVKRVTNLVGEIAASSIDQAQGIAQINTGLSLIGKVTNKNTMHARETADLSENMSAQALHMEQLLNRFKLRNRKRNIGHRNTSYVGFDEYEVDGSARSDPHRTREVNV